MSHLVCPVFHEQTVEAEVEIVQCEHEKNKHSDVWRLNQVPGRRGICFKTWLQMREIFLKEGEIFFADGRRGNIHFGREIKPSCTTDTDTVLLQVERATANPRHPFSHFTTGTRKTLNVDPKSNKNLKYEVFNFFKRQYSANLMSFCLIHNADLQKLEEIAVGRLSRYCNDVDVIMLISFAEKLSIIPNKNIPQTIWRAPVFRKDQLGLKLFIVPVREVRLCHVTSV